MSWYYVEKEFYDYADTIEGVNIHYVCTPLGGVPDWQHQRSTRYMPLVESPVSAPPLLSAAASPATTHLAPLRRRKKILKLPQRIPDPSTHTLTDRYLLHHYFEIFQDGHRYYSPLYTEEIVTGAGTLPLTTSTDS
ncbi:MAG: hypothetical protein NZ578_09520 [Candidatus Binatia bacterium]|nr:hypothetical protein [Candidatus Binatia bacterium]